jgi:hypothetical protein
MLENIKIFWAHIKCNSYLLFYGMWKKECFYKETDYNGVLLISSSIGNLYNRTLRIKKVFYKSENYYNV